MSLTALSNISVVAFLILYGFQHAALLGEIAVDR